MQRLAEVGRIPMAETVAETTEAFSDRSKHSGSAPEVKADASSAKSGTLARSKGANEHSSPAMATSTKDPSSSFYAAEEQQYIMGRRALGLPAEPKV